MGCFAIEVVWTIAGVDASTWYNATHNYANSSRLKNRKCEQTLTGQPSFDENYNAHIIAQLFNSYQLNSFTVNLYIFIFL